MCSVPMNPEEGLIYRFVRTNVLCDFSGEVLLLDVHVRMEVMDILRDNVNTPPGTPHSSTHQIPSKYHPDPAGYPNI